MFSPKSVTVLALTFRSLVYFELIFAYITWGRGPVSYICMWISNCPNTVCWRDCFFHIEWSWYSWWEIVHQRCVGLFPDFQFCSLDLYVYPYASSILFWFSSFVASFEVRTRESSDLFFFVKVVLAIQGSLQFHVNLKIMSISAKKAVGFFIEFVEHWGVFLSWLY